MRELIVRKEAVSESSFGLASGGQTMNTEKHLYCLVQNMIHTYRACVSHLSHVINEKSSLTVFLAFTSS